LSVSFVAQQIYKENEITIKEQAKQIDKHKHDRSQSRLVRACRHVRLIIAVDVNEDRRGQRDQIHANIKRIQNGYGKSETFLSF
jgi:hypothetical protein